MKKSNLIFLMFMALCTLAFITCVFCSCDASIEQRTLANECVRIHIRANSNSDADQQVKLKVRDNITAYLQARLEGCGTKKDAISTLKQEMPNLVEIANNTLYLYNFDYKTSIVLKKEYFPEKMYDGYTFPKGEYDALIICLGSGTGDNWWCVAFPPLCFVPNGNGEKIVYKSWIKELLDKMFGKRA